jgi:hypothetical protein
VDGSQLAQAGMTPSGKHIDNDRTTVCTQRVQTDAVSTNVGKRDFRQTLSIRSERHEDCHEDKTPTFHVMICFH